MDTVTKIYYALSTKLISFKGGHDTYTPRVLVEDILVKSALFGEILVAYNIEFVVSLVYTFKIDPNQITFYSDHENKTELCRKIGVKYVTKLEPYMKFDVLVGNPPFHYMSNGVRVSLGNKLIKEFYGYLNPNGILAIVASTNFLGGGQQGLGYLFSENEVISINLNHKDYFPTVGTDIGSFIIKKAPASSKNITITNNNCQFVIDTTAYRYCGKPYIPRGVTKETEPILRKIIDKTTDVFKFQSSVSKGMQHKIGFWAAAKTGIHPKYFRITHTGSFDNDNITHPCGLDQHYSDDNINSVFAGKIFHWVIEQINAGMSDRNPSNLSYFPKVDLSKFWGFDDLADHFGLSVEDRQVVQLWAAGKKNVVWRD